MSRTARGSCHGISGWGGALARNCFDQPGTDKSFAMMGRKDRIWNADSTNETYCCKFGVDFDQFGDLLARRRWRHHDTVGDVGFNDVGAALDWIGDCTRCFVDTMSSMASLYTCDMHPAVASVRASYDPWGLPREFSHEKGFHGLPKLASAC
jgi:hypothetical protein